MVDKGYLKQIPLLGPTAQCIAVATKERNKKLEFFMPLRTVSYGVQQTTTLTGKGSLTLEWMNLQGGRGCFRTADTCSQPGRREHEQ